jgi:hypothetical protein
VHTRKKKLFVVNSLQLITLNVMFCLGFSQISDFYLK